MWSNAGLHQLIAAYKSKDFCSVGIVQWSLQCWYSIVKFLNSILVVVFE